MPPNEGFNLNESQITMNHTLRNESIQIPWSVASKNDLQYYIRRQILNFMKYVFVSELKHILNNLCNKFRLKIKKYACTHLYRINKPI